MKNFRQHSFQPQNFYQEPPAKKTHARSCSDDMRQKPVRQKPSSFTDAAESRPKQGRTNKAQGPEPSSSFPPSRHRKEKQSTFEPKNKSNKHAAFLKKNQEPHLKYQKPVLMHPKRDRYIPNTKRVFPVNQQQSTPPNSDKRRQMCNHQKKKDLLDSRQHAYPPQQQQPRNQPPLRRPDRSTCKYDYFKATSQKVHFRPRTDSFYEITPRHAVFATPTSHTPTYTYAPFKSCEDRLPTRRISPEQIANEIKAFLHINFTSAPTCNLNLSQKATFPYPIPLKDINPTIARNTQTLPIRPVHMPRAPPNVGMHVNHNHRTQTRISEHANLYPRVSLPSVGSQTRLKRIESEIKRLLGISCSEEIRFERPFNR